MFRTGFKCLLALGACLCLSQQSHASSWVGCDVEARVLEKLEGGSVVIRILNVDDHNSGFGACPHKAGGKPLTIQIPSPEKFADIVTGRTVFLRYMEGSSMTSNGAVSYEMWNVMCDD